MISGGPTAMGLVGSTDMSANDWRSWLIGRVICRAIIAASTRLAADRAVPRIVAQRTVLQAAACSSAFLTATPTLQLPMLGRALAAMSISPSREEYSNTPIRLLMARHPSEAS